MPQSLNSADYYLDMYMSAMDAGREIDCYNNKIVFCSLDTMTPGLTDMIIVWKYCILPLYEMGDLEIPVRVKKIVRELLKTDEVVAIYNAIECIRTYEWLTAISEQMTFQIDFSDIFPLVRAALRRNARKFKKYQGPEFRSLVASPWALASSQAALLNAGNKKQH